MFKFNGLTAEEYFKIYGFMPIAGGSQDDDENGGDGGDGGDDNGDDKDQTDEEIEKLINGEKDDADDKDDKGDDKEKDADDDDDETIDPKDDKEIQVGKKLKLKLSDILKLRRLQGQEESLTKKGQKLSEEFKQVESLREMQKYLKANPAKLQKVLAILEEADEAAKDAKAAGGDSKDVKDAIDEVLEKLDMNNPTNVLLKFLVESNKKFSKEIELSKDADAKAGKAREARAAAEQVKAATVVLTDTLTSSIKELGVTDADDEKIVRQMTLSFLKDNPKPYADEDEFKTTIVSTVKRMKKTLESIGQRQIARYLKNKKGGSSTTTNDTSANGGGKGKSVDLQKLSDTNLQSTIEGMLDEMEEGKE